MTDITLNLDRDSLFETTAELIEAGFNIIQLHPIKPDAKCSCFKLDCQDSGKHPKTNDWRNAKPLIVEQAEALLDHATGYGIVLSNELLVVDVDTKEGKKGLESKKKLEEKLGDKLENLSTFIVESGSGSGACHYYFRKEADIKIRKKLTKEYPDIDFLSEGAYVVSPYSLHQSGGTYEFLKLTKSDPAKITSAPDELISIIERKEEFIDYIATEAGSCSLSDIESMLYVIDPDIDYDEWIKICFAIHYETQGSSDGLALFDRWCSGQLSERHSATKYAGFNEIANKWKSADSPSATKITIGTLYRMAYDYGWEGVQANVEIDFDTFFNSINSGEIEKEVIKTEEGVVYEHAELPKELQHLSGTLGALVQWGMDIAKKPSFLVELVGALQAVSVICGRDFKTNYDDYTNNFFMIVGESGCGKDMVAKMSSKLTNLIAQRYANEDKTLAAEATSPGGLYTSLEICPRINVVHDEIGHWIEGVVKGTGDHGATAAMAMTIYARADDELRRKSYSQQGRKKEERNNEVEKILRPFMCFTGMTTPSQLAKHLTGNLLENGFMNRFLMVIPMEKNKRVRDSTYKPIPMVVAQWIDAIQTRLANYHGTSYSNIGRDIYNEPLKPIVLSFDQDAYEYVNVKFQDEVEQIAIECEKKGYKDAMIRAYEQAKRLALTIQLAKNPFSETVEKDSVIIACELVKYLKQTEINFYDMYFSESKFEAVSKKVLEQIADRKDKGILQKDLAQLKPMSSLDKNGREKVLDSLKDAGMINNIHENKGQRGAPRQRWYLDKYVREKIEAEERKEELEKAAKKAVKVNGK